ncbi:MAG: tetratricopeptide repeat protein [Candidatus Omnitrophica bacterium]|nr:tetratricopeptide repeat protein [Candidatus Omnitrophota bacterium]
MRRFSQIIFILILILVGILIYSNSLKSEFQFDDHGYIVHNPSIRHFSTVWGKDNTFNVRFVGLLSFALNYHFNQLDVFGYHVVNLLIHLLTGLLVFQFIRLLLSAPKLQDHPAVSSKDGLAFLVALVFIAHPIQTQAVTYITQRFASLATMFYMATLCCYLKGRFADSKTQRSIFYYLLAMATALLALFTKQIAFTLPFTIFLLEILFFENHFKVFKKSVMVYLAGVAGFLLIVPLMYKLNKAALIFPSNPSESHVGDIITPGNYFLTQFKVIATYIRLLVVPVGLNLDYDFPLSHHFFDSATLGCFLFLLAIFFVGIKCLKRHRLLAFGIFWFFLTLSVESSFIPIQHVIFEHRVYLPSVGFCMVLCFSLFAFFKDFKRTAIVVIIISAIFSFLTYQRNKDWQTQLTLWEDIVKKSPAKPRVYVNLCSAYYRRGEDEKALRYCHKALELNPYSFQGYNNLGLIYSVEKKYDLALESFNKSLTFDKKAEEVYNNRGNVYAKLGRYDLAVEDFTKAVKLNPLLDTGFNNRGFTYLLMNKLDLALKDITHTIELNPAIPEAFYNRALIYVREKSYDSALKDLDQALKLRPQYADVLYLRGDIYNTLKQDDLALEAFSQTLKADPQYAKAYINRGNLYFADRQYQLALDDFDKAVMLMPDEADIYYNRANVYSALGNPDKALENYSEAILKNPGHFQALNNRGNLYRERKDYDLAVADFTQALKANNRFGVIYYNRAMAFGAKKAYNEAYQDLQKARALGYPVTDKMMEDVKTHVP